MGMSWDNHMPGLVLTNPPKDGVDPVVASLKARLFAAGWSLADQRVGDDVSIVIDSAAQNRACRFTGPTTVDALTEACEAVGA